MTVRAVRELRATAPGGRPFTVVAAIRLTERECRDVLARALAGRLAVACRGVPYVELVGLLCLDGDAVALVPGSGTIARLLPPVVSPRRHVVLQADDLAVTCRWVRAVTVVARPRWVVDVDGVRECRRAARARGLDAAPDTGFLALSRPVLAGERVVLRGEALRGELPRGEGEVASAGPGAVAGPRPDGPAARTPSPA
ncbi:MAG TPA: hypothetical protein VFH94_07615 [Streptomyces sp.]|nr:hypothetical protein [Streptomyces sp.]